MLQSISQFPAFLAIASLTAGPILAQGQVLTVDDDAPADFSTLQSAIAAAGEGDVLLIKDGDYFDILGAPIVIDGKSLSLIADGSNVEVHDAEIVVQNLTAAQNVVIHGLDGDGAHLNLLGNAGTIWIEDGYWGRISDGSSTPRVSASNCAAVNIHRSYLIGETDLTGVFLGGPGLHVSASAVNVYDTVVEGALTVIFGPGTAAVEVVDGGVLFASGCEFSGDPPIGDLFLGDGSPSAYLLDTTGSVTVTTGSVTNFTADARGFQTSSPLREGEAGLFTYTGDSTDLVVLSVGLEPASLLFPAWQGSFQHSPIPGPIVQVLGAPPAFGILQVPFTAPDLPFGFESARFVPQVAVFTGMGGILLGPASHVTIVSDAF